MITIAFQNKNISVTAMFSFNNELVALTMIIIIDLLFISIQFTILFERQERSIDKDQNRKGIKCRQKILKVIILILYLHSVSI